MQNKPFFIIGTERSGSNLLRAILNSHDQITIPHPPHIMKELGPREKSYGDLTKDHNFYRLIDDVIKLVELHFVQWPIQLERESIFKKVTFRSLYAVNAVIYDDYARYMNKLRWGCKSTFMIHYIEEILKVHPSAQFIHLVRDGRDVAVSAKNSVFNHFHPYYVAKLWSKEQSIASYWKEKLSPTQITTLHYEKLTQDPESNIKNICQFLGERYQDGMLRYFENKDVNDLAKLSDSWKNISRAVLADNSNKYKKHLSTEEISLFEALSINELTAFDYKLENDQTQLSLILKNLTRAKIFRYYLEEKLIQLKVESIAMIRDKNFIQRWKKRFHVWKFNL